MTKEAERNNLPAIGRRGWVMLLLILFFAAFLRGWRLSYPLNDVGDEHWYIPAALTYLAGVRDSNQVHPPLGKIMIAASLKTYLKLKHFDCLYLPLAIRNNGVGYFYDFWAARLTSFFCGLGCILLTFLLAYRVSRGSLTVAELAAFFVATDFLSISFSRTATLDMPLSLWVLAGAYFCQRYLEAFRQNSKASIAWALLCAASFGLATATKWSGLAGALVCCLAMIDAGNSPESTNWRSELGQALKLSTMFLAVMAVMYVATYLPQLLREGFNLETVKSIATIPLNMLSIRSSQNFSGDYSSPFWLWPLGLYPFMAQFRFREFIASNGEAYNSCLLYCSSVVLWWPGLYFSLKYFAASIKERLSGLKQPSWLMITSLWLANWLFWLPFTQGGFLYYMLCGLPFMAIVMAGVLNNWIEEKHYIRAAFYLYLVSLALALYYPLLTLLPISNGMYNFLFPQWLARFLAFTKTAFF